MKNIRINYLVLENFKCHGYWRMEPEGASVSIYGDNAAGKTSVFDAYVWLLFGRDSGGNGEKVIDLKPLNETGGVKDHQAVTAVEAGFLVDGENRTFRRTLREVWSVRRGREKERYEGNTSDYFVDGVPVKKAAYDSAIRELVSEELFRMLTSVNHFASEMKWQERRAVLFDLAGHYTDRELMAQQSRFAPLLEGMGGLTLDQYRSKLLHEKKNMTGVKDQLPARISECQLLLRQQEVQDREALRLALMAQEGKKETLEHQLAALEQGGGLREARLALGEAKLRREQVVSRNRNHREAQKARMPDRAAIQRAAAAERARLERSGRELDAMNRRADSRERELDQIREEEQTIREEAFTGGICPSCGQALPFGQLQEARRSFQRRQEVALERLREKAAALEKEQKEAAAAMETLRREQEESRLTLEELEKKEREAASAAKEITDLEGYYSRIREEDETIRKLEARLLRLDEDVRQEREGLEGELEKTKAAARSLQERIAADDAREQTRLRIDQLRREGETAAAALEAVEEKLYLLEEFTRYKAGFAEAAVNGRFRLASFRLFREQANGGLEERCDAQYDGVPFLGLNNGMRVNVGIDIINTLSRFYGVSVPLFIDNAEAVTRLEDCQGQVIRLVVSAGDKTLRIGEY